jgi:hypothetical protein
VYDRKPRLGRPAFIADSPDKVRRLGSVVGDGIIEVDGGIDPSTAGGCGGRGGRPVRCRLGRFRSHRIPAAAYAAIAEAAGAS